ncbi:MAG: ABC transporter permease [Acidimicrobiia bacterium]|nr:ABC transporter permease [Acidimicrobiia bacterium]MDH4309100.1 ABC transporter permease [Acidimicrobiia bacterium]
MTLAFAELRRTRGRFAAIVGAVAFIVFLALILSALGDGLYLGQTGIYRAGDTGTYVYSEDSGLGLARSGLDSEAVDQISRIAPVEGALGTSTLAATTPDGSELQLSMIGASGIARPNTIVEGRWPADGESAVVIDSQLRRRGVDLGSVITIVDGPSLEVVGLANDAGYGFDTVWTSLDTWHDTRVVVRPELAGLEGVVQAVALRTSSEPIRTAIDQAGPYQTASVSEAIAALPAAEQQRSTIDAIVNTTFLVAAIVIGLFFALITLEKRNQFAVLKAIGMGSRRLFGGVLAQALIASAAGFAVGFVAARGVGLVLPADVPALFLTESALSVFATTIVTGLLGALFSFRRILKIDPATALGGAT